MDPYFDSHGQSPSALASAYQSVSHVVEDGPSSDPVVECISDLLLKEDVDDQVWVYSGTLADTERSLYDALDERYPDSPHRCKDFDVIEDLRPGSNVIVSSISDPMTALTSTYSDGSVYPQLPGYYSRTSESAVPTLGHVPQSSSSSALEKKISDNDSFMQFKRGLEEARKFLPPATQLVIDFEDGSLVSTAKGKTAGLTSRDRDDKRGREDVLSGSRDHPARCHELEEGRASKQSCSSIQTEEEACLSVMLDKVLLSMSPYSVDVMDSHIRAPAHRSNGGMARGSRQLNKSAVDLRALLILCAQALSSNDLRIANDLLRQIRQNSSPSGDGTQRLAHYFANGLEARMAATREYTQNFCCTGHILRKSVADVLKTYHLYMSSCPHKKLSILYANYLIWNMSHKASELHIIDFGISFGFQWPILIQMLGSQPGRPPKLRITGIEFPVPGFHPARKIEETGQRLARYCKRFHVPFEFNALPSHKWETIRVEDFKIRKREMIAVNCYSRFHALLPETFEGDSPRDAVLNLIRKLSPDVFVHTVSNGSYNSPFFMARFKEALFHLSSMYDMFDATFKGVHSNSLERTILEGQFYAREIMNAVACEGADRKWRPETYKKWQVRHARAGLKQLPLHQEIMKIIRHKLESYYHKDFMLEEDGSWMLWGWKGRIMYATTCWVPA